MVKYLGKLLNLNARFLGIVRIFNELYYFPLMSMACHSGGLWCGEGHLCLCLVSIIRICEDGDWRRIRDQRGSKSEKGCLVLGAEDGQMQPSRNPLKRRH